MRIDAALREGINENANSVLVDIEHETRPNRPTVKALSFDEPARRPRAGIASTHSSYNISSNTRTDEAKQQNRRSWAGVLTTARSARQIIEDFRSSNQSSYQQLNEARSTNGEPTLYYSTELSPTCSRDPFGGRSQTTPTDEPPSYEEALKLPALRKLTRSITGTDLAGSRRAFLRDVVANRRSCLEGVGVLAEAKVVRLSCTEGEETHL